MFLYFMIVLEEQVLFKVFFYVTIKITVLPLFHIANVASVTSRAITSCSDLSQVGSVLLAGCFGSIWQPQLPCHLLLDKFFSLTSCASYLCVMGWQCIVSWLNI